MPYACLRVCVCFVCEHICALTILSQACGRSVFIFQSANQKPSQPSVTGATITNGAITAFIGSELRISISTTDPTQPEFTNQVQLVSNLLPNGATLDPCSQGTLCTSGLSCDRRGMCRCGHV